MAKFCGEIGYGVTLEQPAGGGVWVPQIVEKKYFGDLIRASRRLSEAGVLNKDVILNNSVSVLADAYLMNNFSNILYVKWNGARWSVDLVEVQPPRLVLQLGGVYNGPVAVEFTPPT